MSWKYSDPAALAFLIIVLVASLSSCARKGPQPSTAPAANQAIPAPPSASATNPGATLQKPGSPTPPPAPIVAAIRAFGVGAPPEPRLPRDYSLGPLQSSRPAEGDEAAVYKVATSFIKGLGEGKLDKELLLPQTRDALSTILAPADRSSADSSAIPYRLGAIELRGQDASLRLRFPAAAGAARTEALLSLRKVGDAWYIEALALEPPKKGDLDFNPDASAGPDAQRR